MTCPRCDPPLELKQQLGLGAGALCCQRLGYPVLSLARGAKRPHWMLGPSGGVHHASLYPADVWHWWTADKAANVGVATGSVSRLAVIDLDVKAGVNGPESFTRFLAAGWCSQQDWDLLTYASRAWTPSGGWHIWLRTPPGVVVPDRPRILPGVDVKGDGGYVVAPPSALLMGVRPGPGDPPGGGTVPVPYVWAAGCMCSVPDAPGWLLPWLETAPAQGSRRGAGGGQPGEPPDLASLLRAGVPRGQRNDTFHRLACSRYRYHGTGPEGCARVLEELRAVWEATDRTGFPWREVETILWSARRFIAGQEQAERAAVAVMTSYLMRGGAR